MCHKRSRVLAFDPEVAESIQRLFESTPEGTPVTFQCLQEVLPKKPGKTLSTPIEEKHIPAFRSRGFVIAEVFMTSDRVPSGVKNTCRISLLPPPSVTAQEVSASA